MPTSNRQVVLWAGEVQFRDSAEIPSEARQAPRGVHAAAGHCLLIVDEAGMNLSENSPFPEALAHLNAEVAFCHRTGALLSRDEVGRAVEAEVAGEVVVKGRAECGQILSAGDSGALVAQYG